MMKSSICTYLDENIIQQDFFFDCEQTSEVFTLSIVYSSGQGKSH